MATGAESKKGKAGGKTKSRRNKDLIELYRCKMSSALGMIHFFTYDES
jgi:hypothetical protein